MFKCSFFFTTGTAGWSETWYNNASTITLAQANLQALVPSRVAILGSQATINYGRITDVPADRGSEVIGLLAFGSGIPGSAGEEEFASTGLLLRVEAGSKVRRPFILRGIPDDVVGNGGQYLPANDPPFANGVASYFNNLNLLGFGLRASQLPSISGFITAIAPDPINVGILKITTDVPHLQTGKFTVRISGRGNFGFMRGRKTAFVTGPSTFNIVSPFVIPPYQGGAQWAVITPVFSSITFFTSLRIVKRAVGRPFGVSRGRRRLPFKII